MRLDGAGEGPFPVAEQLRFDERLRVLGEVQGDETAGEALGEGVGFFAVGDEGRTADGGRGRPFPRAGLPEQEGGEILHPVPELLFIHPDVVGEDVVPEVAPQPLHRLAPPDEAAVDEEEGAADLVEDGEQATRLPGGEAAAGEEADEVPGEGDGEAPFGRGRLRGDQPVEFGEEAVVDVEHDGVAEQALVLPGVPAEVEEPGRLHPLDLPAQPGDDALVQFRRGGLGGATGDFRSEGGVGVAEGVGGGRIGQQVQEVTVGTVEGFFFVHAHNVHYGR